MFSIADKILSWSEVWALLLPLSILIFHRTQPTSLKPVIVYLCLALAINLMIDIVMSMNVGTSVFTASNNPYYNLHSIVRFTCFAVYFIKMPHQHYSKIKWFLVFVFIVFVIVNFIFFENFFNYDYFSEGLLTTESFLLLVFCMIYYLAELRYEKGEVFKGPDFWIVTGLAVYVVVNFFVFLFYLPMIEENRDLAINIWNVHNIAFIIFCIFVARAFYVPSRNKYTV